MGNLLTKPDREARVTSASAGDFAITTPGTFDEDPATVTKNRICLKPALEAIITTPLSEVPSPPRLKHRAPVRPPNSPETDRWSFQGSSRSGSAHSPLPHTKRYDTPSDSGSYTDKYADMSSDSDFFQLIVGPAVDIFVGPEEVQFTLPRKLLYYHSRFAERAIEGFFREASEKALRLPQDDPEVFYWLVQWMLQGNLEMVEQIRQKYQWKNGRQDWREYACRLLCRLWILGDKILHEPESSRRWPGISFAWSIRWGLHDLFCGAQDDNLRTPLIPDIVIEVWQNTMPDIEEPGKHRFGPRDRSLRQILFDELCDSHFHKTGVFDCAEYSECFMLDGGKFAADVLAYLMRFANMNFDERNVEMQWD